MSHFQTHGLCNKLQKWMNLKSLPNTHCNNTNNQCSHTHVHNKNLMLMNSPYKKTSFETLLRRYPKNEQELKCSKINFDSESRENPKRTFESRIIKYDNIKSKIDTNLANIKGTKYQTHIPQVNDENRNTQNLVNLSYQQNENEKLTYQKPMIKRIKLNSQNYIKRNNQKNNGCEQIDEMIQNHNFRTSGQSQKEQNGKMLFRINVAKRINLMNVKLNIDEQRSEQEQEQRKQKLCEHNEDQQNEIYSPMKLQLSDSPKLIFNQHRHITYQLQQSEQDQNVSYQCDIFTLDGYRVLQEGNEEEEVQRQSQEQAQLADQIGQKQLKKIQESDGQQRNESQEEEQIEFQEMEVLSPVNLINVTENLIVSIQNNQTIPVPENQQPIENIEEPSQYPIYQKENLSQNIQHIQYSQKQNEYPQKQNTKPHNTRRSSKPKKQTKILTRSKQQKLNLLNKLSMRLIRKKYGHELSHIELAQKMLSNQNRIQLKAFIQSESLKSHKTIFAFNQLTTSQMKNTLIKYFTEEETVNNQ